MSPFLTLLHHDHENFLRLIDAFETQVKAAELGQRPSYHILKSVIAYFLSYPGKIHHPREDMLLDLLHKKSAKFDAKVSGIMHDHQSLEARLHELGELLDDYQANSAQGRHAFVNAAGRFVARERQHIRDEEAVLVPAALQILSTDEWKWMDSSLGGETDPLFGRTVTAPFARLRDAILVAGKQAHRSS